jgi:hypothetical protein
MMTIIIRALQLANAWISPETSQKQYKTKTQSQLTSRCIAVLCIPSCCHFKFCIFNALGHKINIQDSN